MALVGNPNTGKTTLFNALTGFRRHAANYPGVSVDVGRGPVRGSATPLQLLDLPGTYSLSANSPDEAIVVSTLCSGLPDGTTPDVILAIVDATNLRRNLYLVSQLLEVGRPVVIALNMTDAAEARGIRVDAELLAERLGVPVVPIVATREKAAAAAVVAALNDAEKQALPENRATLPPALCAAARRLIDAAPGTMSPARAVRALLDSEAALPADVRADGELGRALAEQRAALSDAGVDGAAEIRARYAWVNEVLADVIERPAELRQTWSGRFDRVLTHRVWGGLLLAGVLFVLFQAIFAWAGPLMDLIDAGFGALSDAIAPLLPAGLLRSLVVDGVIAGVGGVLIFLPQIAILFAAIALLEDCGYLTRAAFMMDRVMRGVGLSGRSFIPLLSGFACAVPAVMATRTISDRRERIITILLIPFMSCSARLPVYALLIAAFVPARAYLGGWLGLQGLVMLGMYLVGVVVAIPVAWMLKRTVLAGPSPGFLLELPSYKLPRPRAVWQRVYLASASFVVRAGTVILFVNLIVWALAYFPRSESTRAEIAGVAVEQGWDEARADSELAGAYLRESYLGRMGHAIEPAIAPLGWDWRIGIAVIASFPAREVIVATLGTIANLGQDQDEGSVELQQALREMRRPDEGPVFTLPVALSIMVFFALCAQCSSTLVMVAREAGSWRWAAVSFFGMTVIAYLAAWGTAVGAAAAGL